MRDCKVKNLTLWGETSMNLKEIAAAASVSPSTVSLVLNDKPGVSAQTRAAVTMLLCESGYEVQRQKASVATHNIRFLKVISHSMLVDGNPGFITSIMDSIEQECRKEGYNLIVTMTDRSSLPQTIELLKQEIPDGILLLGTEMEEQDFAAFIHLPCPVVVVDNTVDSLPIASITMDNRSAIYASVRHLRDLGHHKIAFLKNELPSSNCRCRERAFLQATAAMGLSTFDAPVFAVSPTTIGAYHSVKQLLERGTEFPSAVIANNDCIALGAAKAFKEYDIKIPADLSLIGFDGIQFSDIADPPLTTVGVPCKEIGTLAVQMLCHFIELPNAAPYKVSVTTKLIIRSSTSSAK